MSRSDLINYLHDNSERIRILKKQILDAQKHLQSSPDLTYSDIMGRVNRVQQMRRDLARLERILNPDL